MSKKNKKNVENEPNYRYYFCCFLVCFVCFTLFAVRLHVGTISGKSLEFFASSDGIFCDWFLHCKEIMLIILSVCTIFYFIGEKIFPDNPCKNDPILTKKARLPVILIGIYLLMTVVSAVFAENRDVVLFGVCSEYEGILAISAYAVLFFAGYNYFTGERSFRFYKRAFFVLIVVTIVLAVIEYTISPLLELPFMKYIIAPEKYRNIAESLQMSDTFRQAVLMFYNSNYMGGFCSIIFPVSVYYVLSAEKIAARIACLLVCAASFVAVIMSNSTAALYVALAEIAFLVIFLTVKKVIRLKNLLLVMVSFGIIAAGLSIASGNEFIKNIVKSFTNAGTYEQVDKSFTLDNISISGNEVHFGSQGSEYIVTVPTEQGETLRLVGVGDTMYTFENTDVNAIHVHDLATDNEFSVRLDRGVLYLDVGYMSTVDFAVTQDGAKLIVQNKKLLDEIPVSPFNGTWLSKYYGFATGRGYIWINSLPILKECLLIGKGVGNFTFCFPQNEVAGLAATNGSYRIIIDKPHNWYLQFAISSGIPAMLALLVLFARYVILNFRSMAKNKYADRNDLFFVCLYTGLCGFMIMGLVNDSCITVAPFFWFNFGIALCNMREDVSHE